LKDRSDTNVAAIIYDNLKRRLMIKAYFVIVQPRRQQDTKNKILLLENSVLYIKT